MKKKAVMKREIIRREVKEKNMKISPLGGLNNESKKKNKIRIKVFKEKSDGKSR